MVGIVAGTFALLPMLLALHFGRFVDRSGSRGVFFLGIVLSALAVGGAAVSPSILVLAVVNTVLGLGQIMTMIGAHGFVMELTERSRHVNGFAAFTLAVSRTTLSLNRTHFAELGVAAGRRSEVSAVIPPERPPGDPAGTPDGVTDSRKVETR